MRLLRRLILFVVTPLVLLVTAGFALVYVVVLSPVSTVGEVDFEQPLAIPPLARSHVAADGTRVFHLTAGSGTSELLPGLPTTTWGYDGSYLGPTLRADRGEKVRVEVRNNLDAVTSVHWHGMHLPAAADGGPHQPIQPGGTWSPSWRIDQPAATLWYHPHPHGETQDQVNRGLAGMFLLDDPRAPAATALPHRYGVDDIPVIVSDKRFDQNGNVQGDGLGEDLLVNGTYGPYLDVTTETVRLRLLNASVRRVYSFGLSDGSGFSLVGTDGGLLHQPERMHRIRLSPGERAETVVSLRPDQDVVLRSYQPDLETNVLVERVSGGQDEFDVLQLRAAHRLTPAPALPQHLAPAPDLDASITGATRTRTFDLSEPTINGRGMDTGRIDEIVELGSTEVWEVRNVDGEYHNFHVHDVQFQVLSVEGGAPGAELSGWKDTIYLPPGHSARLAMRFTDYADPDTPYMFHCHLLQHEDDGMMGQFVVVEPGQQAGTPRHSGHAHH